MDMSFRRRPDPPTDQWFTPRFRSQWVEPPRRNDRFPGSRGAVHGIRGGPIPPRVPVGTSHAGWWRHDVVAGRRGPNERVFRTAFRPWNYATNKFARYVNSINIIGGGHVNALTRIGRHMKYPTRVAAAIVPCHEQKLRRLDPILKPPRDPWDRRLYDDTHIQKAREALAERASRARHEAAMA